MKLRTFILTAILMSLFILPVQAEVHLSFEGNDLIAHSDEKGVEGFKGCEANSLEKIPAYTFRLLKREIPSIGSGCKAPTGKWRQVDEETSNNGSVLFEDVGEGEYKVICLIGKAIGCEINGAPDGYPGRSIVYEEERSSKISNIQSNEQQLTGDLSKVKESGLLLFPNPTQTEVNIRITQSDLQGELRMAIYDLLGNKLYTDTYKLQEAGITKKVQISGYAAGTYLVRVEDANGIGLEGKFVVVSE